MVRNPWLEKQTRTWLGIDRKVIELNNSLHIEASNEGLVYGDIIQSLCNEDGCALHLENDNPDAITSMDYAHLTPSASQWIARKILINLVTGKTDSSAIQPKE